MSIAIQTIKENSNVNSNIVNHKRKIPKIDQLTWSKSNQELLNYHKRINFLIFFLLNNWSILEIASQSIWKVKQQRSIILLEQNFLKRKCQVSRKISSIQWEVHFVFFCSIHGKVFFFSIYCQALSTIFSPQALCFNF